jgi:5-methylcytosine-specific restriction endonuclease McrA
MQRVLVLNADRTPLMPCHPARARALLRAGRAAVYRHSPFTVILREQLDDPVTQPLELKLDPGSKTTGIALVAEFEKRGRTVMWAGNLHHRGHAVKSNLDTRRALRRGRRSRNTRYRAPRFSNRTRPAGWLPPSLLSRIANVRTWARRLLRAAPATSIQVETVRFDTQLMNDPDISGVQYQQGTLAGWELREYLLYRHGHRCAYCGGMSGDAVLEIEHVHPKSKGGSNRVSNLVIACQKCNAAKNNHLPAEWLDRLKASKKPLDQRRAEGMDRVVAGIRPGLKDAAAVNATRYRIGEEMKAFGLPVGFWSGGRTKMNRSAQSYGKDHWIDAACVGPTGAAVRALPNHRPLAISARGRGSRRMCQPDRHGFPRTRAKRVKRVLGFQTGDRVRLVQPAGKNKGTFVGTVSVRERGDFDITVRSESGSRKITAPHHRFTLIQREDGYAYA